MKRRSLLAVPLLVSTSSAWAAPAKPPPKPPARPLPKLIALDPGHGGTDPGALGVNGIQEKAVVITVARELQAQLQAGGRYRVMLTRAGDSFVALRERVARAEAAKADLFLSIHADSHPDPYVRGASIYTLSDEASDREAAALAARENGGPLNFPTGTVARTLVAMAQRGTGNDSRRFADTVVTTFPKSGVRLLPPSHPAAG